MAHTVATIEEAHLEEHAAEQEATNPLANIWLGFLGICLGSTLICSAVLLAWPVIAQLAAQ